MLFRSVLGITHSVFFLGIGKDPLNGFLSPPVQFLVLRRIAGVVRQFLIVLPDVPLYRFEIVFGMSTQMAGRLVDADAGIASVFPVSVSVGGAVGQHLVLWANHTVIVLVIHIFPPLVAALHGLGPLVGCGEYSPIIKYLFADMRRLVGRVRNNGLYFWKCWSNGHRLHQTPRCHGHSRE